MEVAKRSSAYAKTPGIYLGRSGRPAEPGLLREAPQEPLMEPGGEPLTEEDPVPSPHREMPVKGSRSPRHRELSQGADIMK